tara:strand:- start:2531 stop:3214 length:684 start_codon:yes stop_codon:yes gene_type:complete
MFKQKTFTHNIIAQTNDYISENTESGRYYTLNNGAKLPSVTTVTGWKKNRIFANWRMNNPKEAKRVTKRGNMLHSLLEDYVNNETIILKDIPPIECDLFLQMQSEIDKIDNVRGTELALASEMIGVAGRADCIAEYDGKLSVIDFKGSTRKKYKSNIDNYFLQATAYSLMWQEMTEEKIEKIVIIIGCETGDTQVFADTPINWTRPLQREIREYTEKFPQDESASLF